MFTWPNLLSLMRIPLAFAFLEDHVIWRTWILLLALLTDGLDGYLARKTKKVSQIGAFLDPLTDKFFVCFVMFLFVQEGKLNWLQFASLLSRDFALLVYGVYLAFSKALFKVRFRSIWAGKITTFFQFIVFLGLLTGYVIPNYVYGFFVLLGVLALIELFVLVHPQEVDASR